MADVPQHFFRQSAVIPYRFNNGVLEILLITSRKKKKWIIPKGVIEPDLKPWESAQREALEEAGCIGDVCKKKLGTFENNKWQGTCSVEVYSMEVKEIFDKWDEDFRDRKWFSSDEVLSQTSNKNIAQIVKVFIREKLIK